MQQSVRGNSQIVTKRKEKLKNEEDNWQTDGIIIERQSRALSGYRIVDGKYIDRDGNIRETDPNEWTTTGPDALDVYRKVYSSENQFWIIASAAFVDATEYLSRVGELLRAAGESCMIVFLNAMQYSVNVIVGTDLSH